MPNPLVKVRNLHLPEPDALQLPEADEAEVDEASRSGLRRKRKAPRQSRKELRKQAHANAVVFTEFAPTVPKAIEDAAKNVDALPFSDARDFIQVDIPAKNVFESNSISNHGGYRRLAAGLVVQALRDIEHHFTEWARRENILSRGGIRFDRAKAADQWFSSSYTPPPYQISFDECCDLLRVNPERTYERIFDQFSRDFVERLWQECHEPTPEPEDDLSDVHEPTAEELRTHSKAARRADRNWKGEEPDGRQPDVDEPDPQLGEESFNQSFREHQGLRTSAVLSDEESEALTLELAQKYRPPVKRMFEDSVRQLRSAIFDDIPEWVIADIIGGIKRLHTQLETHKNGDA